MAKRRHRIFEIFDFRDEALNALTPKTLSLAPEVNLPKTSTYSYLSISHVPFVTQVGFNKGQTSMNETANSLNNEFAQLAEDLTIDSKVLLDFTNVESFRPTNIEALALFNTRLRHKGSRLVLCCLDARVSEHLYSKVNQNRQPMSSNYVGS